MTDLQKLLAAGILLNSALYLTGVVAAGLVTGNDAAWKMALAAMGLCYVSYTCQFQYGTHWLYQTVGKAAVACSIVAGVAAGIFLLIGS